MAAGKMKCKGSVIVFCAHNDDQIIGVGGTLARYAKEGIDVTTVIFSYGILSHPHFKKKVAVGMRVKESRAADKILGLEETYYLGLKEGKFRSDFDERNMQSKLCAMIKEKNPSKIFTHSIDDAHPDHRATYDIVMGLIEKARYKGDVYSFEVWHLFNIMKRNKPRLMVDITNTLGLKVAAFKAHRSQAPARMFFMWQLYLRAMLNGRDNRTKYAEVFYKIR